MTDEEFQNFKKQCVARWKTSQEGRCSNCCARCKKTFLTFSSDGAVSFCSFCGADGWEQKNMPLEASQ